MRPQKQTPTLRQLCDEFTARDLERDHDAGKVLIQSAEKDGRDLVVELIQNDTILCEDANDDQDIENEEIYLGKPVASILRLECSQMSKERLLKRFNQKTKATDVPFNPHHPSARQPLFSHKRSMHSCHGVTGTYKGSKELGLVEHARNPDGTIDKRSLRLSFLPNENGETRKPVFVNYTTPRLAAEALDVLKETAKKNRHEQLPPNAAPSRERQKPAMAAGLHKFLG